MVIATLALHRKETELDQLVGDEGWRRRAYSFIWCVVPTADGGGSYVILHSTDPYVVHT